jgi:hypothetical protein
MTEPKFDLAVAPRELARLFGKPPSTKFLSESVANFVFESTNGDVVTLYLVAHDLGLFVTIFRWRFWKISEKVEFRVGSVHAQDAREFCFWLSQRAECTFTPLSWTKRELNFPLGPEDATPVARKGYADSNRPNLTESRVIRIAMVLWKLKKKLLG